MQRTLDTMFVSAGLWHHQIVMIAAATILQIAANHKLLQSGYRDIF